MFKVIFSVLAAFVVTTSVCSAADLDSVDYYDLDPVYLSPMTASALDYGIALAATTDWSTTDSANLSSIKDSLTNTASNITVAGLLYDIEDYTGYIPNMNTQLNSIAGYLHGVSSNNLADDIYLIRRDVSTLSSGVSSIVTTLGSSNSYLSSISQSNGSIDYNFSFALGLIDQIRTNSFFDTDNVYGVRTLYGLVSQLQQVLASDDDLALANSQKANREEIENTFLSGSSGSTSLGVSDFGDLADVGGTIKDSLSLDGNATIGSFTSGLAAADSAGQGWFSEETRAQLDAVSSTVTYSLRDSDPYNMAGWEDRYYWLLGDDD